MDSLGALIVWAVIVVIGLAVHTAKQRQRARGKKKGK